MSEKKINLTLKVWRQSGPEDSGKLVTYDAPDIPTDMSFLEMLDLVNAGLIEKGEDPIAFDHDCREGICGACGAVVNGQAHGPQKGTTLCQLHMRQFADGETLVIEPFRANAFPIIKDLVVNRSAFDHVITAGGYVSVGTGAPQDANALPIPKPAADAAFDAAACIGCGACVAACPNASAMLFVGAKVSQLALLPQGAPERTTRVLSMVRSMDGQGFGNCSNHGECSAACPKEIPMSVIVRMNREYLRAAVLSETD